MKAPHLRCIATAALAALLIAACGSSYTKQDYIQQAEGICSSTLHAVRVLTPPPSTGAASARDAGLADYLDRIVPLMRRELRRLRALPSPSQTSAQRRALARYVAALQLSVTQFGTLAAAAHAGETQAVNASEAALAANRAPQLAAAYGLKACSGSAATYG